MCLCMQSLLHTVVYLWLIHLLWFTNFLRYLNVTRAAPTPTPVTPAALSVYVEMHILVENVCFKKYFRYAEGNILQERV